MYKTNLSKIRLRYLVNMLPLILLIVIYYTRIIYETMSPLLPVLLVLFWCFQSLFLKPPQKIFANKWSFLWLIYLLLGLFMVLIGLAEANVFFYISRLSFYVLPIAGYFVVNYYNRKEQLLLLVLFSIVFFVNLGWNFYLGYTFPSLFESLESTEESKQLEAIMNVAPTAYHAVCLFSIGIALMFIDNFRTFISYLFSGIIIAVLFYFMISLNSRATAIIVLLLLMIGIYIAKREPRRIRLKIYYITRVLLVVVLGSIVVLPVLVWLVNNIDDSRLIERFQTLVDFTSAKGNMDNIEEGSFTQRILLMQTSLETFCANPINMMIGIGEQTNVMGVDLMKTGIGNHSEFTDVLARHGIIGAILFWNILSFYFRWLKSLSSFRAIIKYVCVLFVIYIIYGFLNKVFQPILLIFMFIIFPICVIQLDYLLSKYNNYFQCKH